MVRKIGKKIILAKIIETEAYCGPKDKASHASKGLTLRTKVMFGPPGHAYIYLIYGMYHCLNIVTEREGYPAAVLIRGVEIDDWRVNGPGKVCRELKIDKKLNDVDLVNSKEIWLEDRGGRVAPTAVKRSPRIGIDYAGDYKHKLGKFYI